ncbi:GNAT family N-acetyltransferase [Marinomonas pollencensis]|uniref:Ribosomal-protein-alanine N-acetyltransferase n=1 Tax=Marinomonas pollencensis TaxID=491954 RepID=A0A3E0DMX9_9GAMM|nr:GNAT family N-acetyltransferase [Marinomonas pollencensis]REG84187.1 ribosomal-protein-alanine N-acetyltransferase [Marinomonas pollencensis]
MTTPSPMSAPCYAVLLSSSVMLENMTYRIMVDKLIDLAKGQDGFLAAECSLGETDLLLTYWQDRATAEHWLNHPTLRRTLLLAEQFWFESYHLRLFEVLSTHSFKQTNSTDHSSRFPRITTARGVLKILEESQADLLKAYVTEEKHFLAPWEPQRAEAYYSIELCRLRIREMRRDFLEDQGLALCFLSPDETRMLGYANYSHIVRGVFQSCHLGYSLRESEQGKGLMHELLTAGNHYLHKECRIDRIQANYMPRNARSAAVLSRLGFSKEGYAKNYLKINGQWEDHVLTALVMR